MQRPSKILPHVSLRRLFERKRSLYTKWPVLSFIGVYLRSLQDWGYRGTSRWKKISDKKNLILFNHVAHTRHLNWSRECWFITGAFCDRQSDCKDQDLCCVREAAINPAISICKPALDEHQTCGPYNQYRTLYIGGTVQPACGPCKQGLTCKQVG